VSGDRVGDFLRRTEARSLEDVIDAITAVSEAVADLNKTVKALKIEPYVHVTAKTPEIKLPDIHRKETIVVNLPTGFMFLAMSAPYIIIIGVALLVKFLPLVTKP
jgi:hypothetical protein